MQFQLLYSTFLITTGTGWCWRVCVCFLCRWVSIRGKCAHISSELCAARAPQMDACVCEPEDGWHLQKWSLTWSRPDTRKRNGKPMVVLLWLPARFSAEGLPKAMQRGGHCHIVSAGLQFSYKELCHNYICCTDWENGFSNTCPPYLWPLFCKVKLHAGELSHGQIYTD